MRGLLFALLAILALPIPAAAEPHMRLEISEQALNELLEQMGDVSDWGVFTPRSWEGVEADVVDCSYFGPLACDVGQARGRQEQVPLALCRTRSGEPVLVPGARPLAWQWWITEAAFDVRRGGMKLTAMVRYRVGQRWFEEQRSVGARLVLDAESGSLKTELDAFQVPIQVRAAGRSQQIGVVDVARHLGFEKSVAIPLLPVPAPGDEARTLRPRIVDATTVYANDRVEVRFDVAF